MAPRPKKRTARPSNSWGERRRGPPVAREAAPVVEDQPLSEPDGRRTTVSVYREKFVIVGGAVPRHSRRRATSAAWASSSPSSSGPPIAVLVDLLMPRGATLPKTAETLVEGLRVQRADGGEVALRR